MIPETKSTFFLNACLEGHFDDGAEMKQVHIMCDSSPVGAHGVPRRGRAQYNIRGASFLTQSLEGKDDAEYVHQTTESETNTCNVQMPSKRHSERIRAFQESRKGESVLDLDAMDKMLLPAITFFNRNDNVHTFSSASEADHNMWTKESSEQESKKCGQKGSSSETRTAILASKSLSPMRPQRPGMAA